MKRARKIKRLRQAYRILNQLKQIPMPLLGDIRLDELNQCYAIITRRHGPTAVEDYLRARYKK